MMRLCLAVCLLPASALAQDAAQRQRALPFVVEQRNLALDGSALCQGDLAELNMQLGALRIELAAAKVEIDRLTKKEPPQ